ncbi:CHASE2 domain-containing protein [Thermodesulfobacteriota bacterium]
MKKFVKSLLSLNTTSITTGLIIIILVLFFIGVPIFDIIELKTYDLRFKLRGIEKPLPNIALAVIDEKSLDTEGRWPWPRSKIANMIDILSQDGAKVIGFDIGFLEPDENSSLKFIKKIDQQISELKIRDSQLLKFIEDSKTSEDNDLNLANSIRRSKSKIILGHFFHISQASLEYEIAREDIEKQLNLISNSRYPLIRYEQQDMYADPFITAYAPESNIEIISKASESSGYFNMFPDQDGVVRWIPFVIKGGEEIYSPLSFQAVWNYLDNPQTVVKVAPYGIEGIQMGKVFIPTDENGQVLINYLGPERTFPHYSIGDILDGKLPKGTFDNAIVLVGATAIGVYDMRNTPFSPIFPGLEIHATVIDNVLKGNFLHKPKWAKIYDFLAIIILGLIPGIALPRLSALKGILFTVALFILHIFISRLLFVQFGLWVNIVYPLLTIAVIYTSLTLFHYITEERERKKIRGAFSFYVSSSVVNEMLQSPERLKLGGDKKELSVLFSDIRGFTTISEGLSPEELVHLLNEYLTVMTDIVFKYDGTLDKYMGDAIMAIYGAPLEQPDHPSRACQSALDMMEGLKELNEKWIREGKKALDIRIGINTGPMLVGNMGSDQRFDYTVMGDAVNLGSRLEGANKSYKTNILISESTYERVMDEFVCMELDSVRVKGKTLPVAVYQLVGERSYVSSEYMAAIDCFHKGLQLYRKQKWSEAIEIFKTVTAMNHSIYASSLYIERATELKNNPPPSDWDGVFTMKTK